MWNTMKKDLRVSLLLGLPTIPMYGHVALPLIAERASSCSWSLPGVGLVFCPFLEVTLFGIIIVAGFASTEAARHCMCID